MAEQYTVPLIINGEEITTSTTFPVTSPVSHKQIWSCSSASNENVQSAIAAAQAAFPAWSKTKPAARRDILIKASQIVKSRTEELAGYMEQETGSHSSFSSGFNVPLAAEMFLDVAGRISTITGVIPNCSDDGTNALVVKEPYGVTLGISPWNAPYILGVRAILYALATGNTCILKGSELSPRCFWAIGSVLKEAGLPAGVLNVLYHRPEDAPAVTAALVENTAVKHVNFTGSTAVGRIIAQMAGKSLKPVIMELGGKASALVLDDADLKKAALQCALGSFIHSGQVCMATERILVHKSIKAAFVQEFKGAVEQVFGSDKPPLVLVQAASVAKNKRLISEAVKQGANIVVGDPEKDEEHPETKEASKTRMRPIIVDQVTKEMELYYTESFGPTVSVMEVESDEEAISIANDTEYGLTGAVFTENLARGIRVARQIESGAVHINAMTIHDETNLPHGGAKMSGWGRFNGNWGLEEFLRLKTITYQE
ncbi:aldehyde dehydrogenase [Periconia macrospinosa]|uniref:Aldehyde dehydrogenase n=1 Tax=Periconia macrospinosa TaxID=97972 RepID=A0A2V1DF99_9PLEO|nr:aldehyde dehydrogenase [Periconia macrospinosa]